MARFHYHETTVMSKELNSVRRLRAYIYSGSKILPDDLEAYTAGHVYENKCLFCRNPASKNPVMCKGVDTWTQMCEFCYKEVMADLPKYLPDAQHAQKEKLLLNSLSRGYDFNIADIINKYYTHLDGGKKDYFAGDKSIRCFVCDRQQREPKPYEDEDDFFEIEIPVRSDMYIIGGKINICKDPSCTGVHRSYVGLLSSLGYNNQAKANDVIKAYCGTCRKEYIIIGDDEIAYRAANKQDYEWQCPSCTYRMLNVWEKDKILQKFYPGTPGEPRNALLPRFTKCKCCKCHEDIEVDNSQTEFSFFLNNVYEEKLICRKCSLLRTWFEMPTVLNILNTRIYTELHSDYTFSIFRLSQGGLETLVLNGNSETDNMIDTVFVAYEETIKLLGSEIAQWK